MGIYNQYKFTLCNPVKECSCHSKNKVMLAKYLLLQFHDRLTIMKVSLVPRPHPLTRRNGLVNQVDFLGLVHAFATM